MRNTKNSKKNPSRGDAGASLEDAKMRIQVILTKCSELIEEAKGLAEKEGVEFSFMDAHFVPPKVVDGSFWRDKVLAELEKNEPALFAALDKMRESEREVFLNGRVKSLIGDKTSYEVSGLGILDHMGSWADHVSSWKASVDEIEWNPSNC